METKWYHGVNLELVQPEKWPFDIEIMNGDKELISWRRYAYGSSNKSVAEVMDGLAFKGEERQQVISDNARQVEFAKLFAAAPETATQRDELLSVQKQLVEALEEAVESIITLYNCRGNECEGSEDDWIGNARAAILAAKASS